MSKIYKIFNPIIWVINHLNYLSHLEMWRIGGKYEPYDFTNDWGYF